MRSHVLLRVVVLALVGLDRPAIGQCSLEWSSGGPQPQLSGWGTCSTQWDPDGAGPAPARLVVGGAYLLAGTQPIDNLVMTWDGSQWETLGAGPGTGVNGTVRALTNWNGLLVAGGTFTGGGTDHIALWSGSQWQPLGAGFPVSVQVLTVWNGNLIALSHTGGVPIIRSWNGVTWTALPTPPSLQFPTAAISYQGLLCVGGSGALERWNGTSWLSSIPVSPAINCLAVRPSQIFGGADTLYAAGSFTIIGGTPQSRLAATSGGASFTWSGVGGGLSNICSALVARNSGLAGFTLVALTNSPTTPVMRYVINPPGTGSWTSLGNPGINSLAYYGGVYHGTSSATGDNAFVSYDGSAWVPVRGPGIDGEVRAATRIGDDMVVGGTFTDVSGVPLSRIARWDGGSFQPLGPGLTGTRVDALVTLDDGDVVAGGLFLQAGPTALNHIGRWDGSAWSGFGTGFDQQVLAICKLPNGDLVAGGRFLTAGGVPCARIARWNGTAWSAFGNGMNGDVMALAVRGDGTLFAGGSFTVAGGVACSRIAQWTGTSWIQVGAGCNGDVHALAVRPNDDVVAVGAFTSAGGLPAARCARWTGSSWAAMGAASADTTIPRAVLALPNGDVIAGRGFHQPSGTPDAGISRWNGSTWSGLGAGLGAHFSTVGVTVRALAFRQDGELIVGGTFSSADGVGSRNLARLSTTCPAAIVPYGAGCVGPGGSLSLAASNLPWSGSTFEVTAAGLGASSFGFVMLSLGQILPGVFPIDPGLVGIVPGPGVGCDLLIASLDHSEGLVPAAGAATWSLPLTPVQIDPTLPGLTFYLQVAELDFAAGWVGTYTTNALSCTVGAF